LAFSWLALKSFGLSTEFGSLGLCWIHNH